MRGIHAALAAVAVATLGVAIAACGSKKSASPLPAGCQPLLDGQDCLLPYPSDFFRAAAATGTGHSIVIPAGIGPVSGAGEAAIPDGLSDYDGFSPGTPVVTVWPVAVATTGLVRVIDDPAPTALATSPTVIVEVPTGRLVPHFVDIDRYAADPRDQAFVLRPLDRYRPGMRYVVAIRHVQRVGGGDAPVPANFRKIRDGQAAGDPRLAAVAARYETDVFPVLQAAGIARADLQQAWDFTVADPARAERDMLRVRELTMDWLATNTPTVQVTSVVEHNAAHVWRNVQGTVNVPLFVTSTDPGADFVRDGAGAVMIAGTAQVPFLAIVGSSVEGMVVPGRAIGYGHGFFGTRDEVADSASRQIADALGATLVAIDWWGMSTIDGASVLGDLGLHPQHAFRFVPRVHQAMANWMVMMAAMRGPLAADPAFQRPGGGNVYDPSRVDFLGISQGHLLGATLAAIAPDLQRVGLENGCVAWTNVMFRAEPFQAFLQIASHQLPQRLAQQEFLAMGQSLLDPIDGVTWAPHVLADKLPGSVADRRVLLHMGLGDIEVPNHGTLMHARELNIPVVAPVAQVPFGLTTANAPFPGSALAIFDFGIDLSVYMDPVPPASNPVHEGVRLLPTAQAQLAAFFEGTSSQITQPCSGVCDPN